MMHIFIFLVEGGMDFRAMLMKRKKPAKKVVVVSSKSFAKVALTANDYFLDNLIIFFSADKNLNRYFVQKKRQL